MKYIKKMYAVPKIREIGETVHEAVKKLLDVYNFLPPLVYDKEKILFYAEKNNKAIGCRKKIKWILSPYSLPEHIYNEIDLHLVISEGLSYCFPKDLSEIIWKSIKESRWIHSAGVSTTKAFLSDKYSKNNYYVCSYTDYLLWNISYSHLRDKIEDMYLTEAFKSGLGFIIFLRQEIYLTPFPKCSFDKYKNLHSDSGPAVIWPDGKEEYYLNCVKVPKEIVETPAEKLDPHILLETSNAEVRREIIRKIGIEKVCHDLKAKVIDKEGDYELLLLHLGDRRKRPYLKMRNPSIGCYHIEGVHPRIKTVKEALAWRNKTKKEPIVMT